MINDVKNHKKRPKREWVIQGRYDNEIKKDKLVHKSKKKSREIFESDEND